MNFFAHRSLFMPRPFALAFCTMCLLTLAACQPTKQPAALPLPNLTVGIAPFTQPTRTVELLAGYIPSSQHMLTQEELHNLDTLLAAKLSTTGRSYVNVSSANMHQTTPAEDSQGRRSALASWVQTAKNAGVDILLIPQVIDWRDRVGGSAGVVTPAAVTVDFFLVDARQEGTLLQRSHYAEEQASLSSNLLGMGSFFKRKGKWVKATDLAEEGMTRAIEEFGL